MRKLPGGPRVHGDYSATAITVTADLQYITLTQCDYAGDTHVVVIRTAQFKDLVQAVSEEVAECLH